MKKLAYIFSLLALLVGSLPISAQESKQYALYNYRNDGDFDAFMNVDIDSITYSCFDLDSVEHEDIVVQEVWTPAQVYRIPIEAIDSIGFRAPKTEYREGVFFITEQHVPYVKAIDDLNITFDSSTPASLLPSVGQVLVTETSEGLLDDGFAGRVTSIRNTDGGVEYVCDPVSLSDIFEQFSFVSKCSTESDMDVKSYLAKAPRRSFYDIGIDEVIKIDLDEVDCTPRDDDEEKIPVSFRYKPEMDITCLVSVVKNQPAVAKVLFHHSHSLYIKAKYEAEWGDSKEWWFSKKDIRIHIPIAAVDAVIKPYVNFGAFVDWNCKVKFEYELPLLKFEQTFGLDYSEYRPEEDRVQFINETEFIHDDPTISLSLDGSLAFGLAIKLGAKLIHKKLLNFEAIFHVGPELKGHVDLSTDRIGEDANLYRQLKNTTVELDGYVAIPQASFQYFGSGVKLAKRGTWKGAKWSNKIPKTEDLLPNDKYPDGYMIDWPIKKWYIVPHFNVPEVYEASSTSAVATLYPYQNLLLPVKLGMAFENYTTGEVIEQDYGSYWGENHNAESDYVRTFDNLKASNIYKVYPTVSLLGMKMHAEPSTDYGVSAELVVSPQRLTINKGETGEVNVLGGTRDYDAIDDNSAIARSVSFNYNQGASNRVVLTVYGNSVGETYITILDKGNGSSQIVNVTVVDPNVPSLTLSTTSLSVDARTSNRVQITSGSGSYTAVSDHPEIATASVYDSNIAIEAYAAGTAIITITDTQSGQTATIEVTVVDALPDLVLSTSAVSLTVGGASTVNITSGSGSYTVSSDNSSVATAALSGTTLTITPISAGTATITVTDTQSGQTATIAVMVTANNPTTDAVAVDLGLPSGTKWADRNVDALSPEDYGGCYNWGETEALDLYNWRSYSLIEDGICCDIGFDIAGTQYDVAHVKWGGAWIMPSSEQVKELIDNCSSEWTELHGVNGLKFTGPNGNSIFLPAAGLNIIHYDGQTGYYWTSTFCEANRWGYATNLIIDQYYGAWDNEMPRAYGHSVRPVLKGSSTPSSDITISVNSVSLRIGSSIGIVITSGNGRYSVQSSNNNVATAAINGKTVMVRAFAAGTATITVSDIQSGQTTTISVTVIIDNTNAAEIVAVDLGLPSGTKWADRNVGASTPEEYGGYYAWGETDTKAVYDWSTYVHCDGSSSTCHDIGSDIAGTQYDVAHVNWGGSWKMPNVSQVIELYENCSWEWITQNGVNGCKFTGPNGNSIFLPAAGYRKGDKFDYVGFWGFYWSSTDGETRDDYIPRATFLHFDSTDFYDDITSRIGGQPIRPVSE